jgi:ectoine hydroxylase-related dioxygenase (phytanoyl-CoA dioxygenase family)
MRLKYYDCESPLEEVLEAIQQDGAAVMTNVVGEDDLATITRELEPFLSVAPKGRDDFTGKETQRTGALIARTPMCREFVMHKRVLAIAHEFLRPHTEKLTVHLTQAVAIHPGEVAQQIHRDREAWGTNIPPNVEPQFNTLWAITDFTADNGATQVIPGSQKWLWDREPEPDQILQAEMPKGSVLLYTGTVLHGGGANRSSDTRISINLTYCVAWLRQQENQYLSCPPHIAKDLDEELQELLGYTQATYGLGYYSDPEAPPGQFDPLVPELALGRGPRKRERFNIDQLSEVAQE